MTALLRALVDGTGRPVTIDGTSLGAAYLLGVRFTDSLPRNELGKVQKNLLR